jgi:hypothetical protein
MAHHITFDGLLEESYQTDTDVLVDCYEQALHCRKGQVDLWFRWDRQTRANPLPLHTARLEAMPLFDTHNMPEAIECMRAAQVEFGRIATEQHNRIKNGLAAKWHREIDADIQDARNRLEKRLSIAKSPRKAKRVRRAK